MSDIDDELLALAGGASSDEEEDADAPMDVSRGSDSPARPIGKSSGRKNGNRKRSRRNDSEEEGETSSGNDSPISQRSAPIDELDSDSDAAAELFDDDSDKYPYEGKFIDTADKREIMAMSEINREEILAERAQEIEKRKQSALLRSILASRNADSKKQEKKRKAGAADLEDSQRKTSRQRTKLGGGKVGEASTGIDSLKKARAEKDNRQRRRAEDNERNKGQKDMHDIYSDADADGDSEVEWDDGRSRNKKSKSPDYRDAEPADLHDIERVRVGRSRFAMVCFYPGFEEAITGCFVRISIGMDKGHNVYRMAVIKGFVEDKPYALESQQGKPFKTTQYVRAAHGKSERNWPFITCSDSPFTEAEWNRYKQACSVENVPIQTKPKLLAKVNDINNLINRSWTEAELQEKLTKSGVLVSKFLPVERARLNGLIKDAVANGNVEGEAAYRAELDALEGPKLAYNTTLQVSPKKQQGLTQQERLAVLNKQNRRKNAEEIRQAQINERRAHKRTEAAIARGEDVVADHSRRVKTRAKFKHDVSDTPGLKRDDSSANTPLTGTPNLVANKATAPIPYMAKLQERKGIPTIRRPVLEDDVLGDLDLGIDEVL